MAFVPVCTDICAFFFLLFVASFHRGIPLYVIFIFYFIVETLKLCKYYVKDRIIIYYK